MGKLGGGGSPSCCPLRGIPPPEILTISSRLSNPDPLRGRVAAQFPCPNPYPSGALSLLARFPAGGGGWVGRIFGRKKKQSRAEWEVYEDKRGPAGGDPSRTEDRHGNNYGVLFDVDAIRAELAKDTGEEELQPKELQSTLPPMVLQSPASSSIASNPRDSLRETRSAHGTLESYRRSASGSHAGHDWGHRAPDDDDGIQMTFDTAFEEAPRLSPRPDASSSTMPSPVPAPSPAPTPAPARPEIKSANTAPNVALADPWADDDEEEFGKEKEISMTFA